MARRMAPAAVQEAKGNTQRRPRTQRTGASVDASPSNGTMPGWLNTKKQVRKAAAEEASRLTEQVWAFLHPELSRLNLVKATDEIALGRFCRYMAEWIVYTHILDREGTFYTTSSQHVGELRRPHPAFKQRKDVEQHLKDLGDVLGLSPSARQRLLLQLANNSGLNPGSNAPQPKPEGGDQLPGLSLPQSPIGMLSSRTMQ